MEKQILYLSGNDKYIALWLYEVVPGANDSTVKNPFDFSSCDEIVINLVYKSLNKPFTLSHVAAQGDVNKRILQVPYTLPAGAYDVEVKVRIDSLHFRSYESDAIQIVRSNKEVRTSFERISNDPDHCDMAIEMQVVPSALVRPLNMYELWKQQPGNEDGTFYDFMTIYMAALVEPAAQELLSGKVDKEAGKGLSSFDFDEYYKGTVDSLLQTTAQLGREIEELKKRL
jgi:hypothetical protein